MRKSSLLAVSLLFAASSAYAVATHSEINAQLDIVDQYHTYSVECKAAVIEYHEEGMDSPACTSLLDGLGVLETTSKVIVEYTGTHRSNPAAIPDSLMDRLIRSGVKAQEIADTINLLCGRLNWCK